jgi:hypothetical protein
VELSSLQLTYLPRAWPAHPRVPKRFAPPATKLIKFKQKNKTEKQLSPEVVKTGKAEILKV